jgi:hypothetical protein
MDAFLACHPSPKAENLLLFLSYPNLLLDELGELRNNPS